MVHAAKHALIRHVGWSAEHRGAPRVRRPRREDETMARSGVSCGGIPTRGRGRALHTKNATAEPRELLSLFFGLGRWSMVA